MLVLAANLKQIEEIRRRGVDGDQVFVVFWCGVWERLDLEVVWSLLLSVRATGVNVLDVVP